MSGQRQVCSSLLALFENYVRTHGGKFDTEKMWDSVKNTPSTFDEKDGSFDKEDKYCRCCHIRAPRRCSTIRES